MRRDEGYERLTPIPSSVAVRWWFYLRRDSDGFAFARGGRVRTCRQARAEIRAALIASENERTLSRQKPTQRLQPDGSLVPLELARSG